MGLARQSHIVFLIFILFKDNTYDGTVKRKVSDMLPLVNYPDLRLTPKRSELATALWYSGYLLPHLVI